MLTNTERQQIVKEVNAGTYGIDEALDDIAAAQKGEEVRKALYAEALVLNREGHAGSTDMIARQQIANLQTSVNGQISTLRTEVGDDIDDLETALNSGLATQNGKIAAQNATIANVVANYNVEYGSETLWEATGETGLLASGTTATLSKDVSNFDYVDIYSFCGNRNVLDTVPVDAKLQSSQGYALRWVNLSDPDSGSYKAYVRIIETRLHIIGTTLTIDHQVTYRNGEEENISGAEVTQSNRSTYMGEFGIMKIVGRKITANAEVTDIRVGADGTEYASAGQAVRAQVTALESAIPAVDSTLSTQGAAADAKIVGDELTNVKADLTAYANSLMDEALSVDVSEEISTNTQKYFGFNFVKGKIYRLKITFTSTNMPRVRIHLSTGTSVSYRTDYIGEFYISTGDILENIIIPTQNASYVNVTCYAGSGTQEYNITFEEIPDIPIVDNTLAISGYAADAKVTGELTKKIVTVIDEEVTRTYAELPSENLVCIPFAYSFTKGKTYKISIVADTVNLDHKSANQVMLDSSRNDSTSVSGLVDMLLRTGSSDVNSGDSWNITFVPTVDNIKSLLLRFKPLTGTQTFSILVTEETTLNDVIREVSEIDKTVKQIPNQSRMQFGAHRGAEAFAPPNCVAAYEIAGKMGFQWAWLAQIRWSSSKTLYVMHDEDVSIITNGTGNISDLSDEYIQSLLCNKLQVYDYSKFTDAELRVPTLEQVIQICLKYGMKMCFRIEPFPSDMESTDNALIWNNFANLIKEYNIKDGIYSGYNSAEMLLCRTLIGDNENLCPFLGNSTTGQDYIDFFTASNIGGKRSVLLYYKNATFSDIKLLHKNGIEVYVFYNGTYPAQAEVEQWASWGVEILQNPYTAKLSIE